ncbi:hypothetical protein [Nostoc sp. FACHB-145]|uniref:hypothetical protein n=1 Tax=Nostoc sp. FACHB-145 TaxID=2692836 RepID=UPI00168736FD|nr:hypothetical protein [Nostoc sp. FACHB-145]MBD2472614.1 hypothetical protein [Nostoc sp. FACHB-145]
MKPPKKPELLIIKKSPAPQSTTEEQAPIEPTSSAEPVTQQQPDAELETPDPQYITRYAPVQSYPVLQSVGNTGWQVSDIWRDLRIDSFSN